MTRKVDDDDHKTRHIDRPLGERLRLERDARRLTRASLAETLDVSESTVQQWEEGRTRLPAARLWQVCRHLNIDVAEIFDGLPHHVAADGGSGLRESGATFVDDSGRIARTRALTRAAAKLPKDRLEIAVDLIKALKSRD